MNKNKQFGYLFFLIFLIITIYSYVNSSEINYISLGFSLIFLLITLIKPVLFEPLNNIWIKFGKILGNIIAPIVMAIIFFIILTPISFILKLIGKDLLNTKFLKKKTYWIKRKKNIGTMNRQF